MDLVLPSPVPALPAGSQASFRPVTGGLRAFAVSDWVGLVPESDRPLKHFIPSQRADIIAPLHIASSVSIPRRTLTPPVPVNSVW